MVCYAVPAVAAIFHFIFKNKVPALKHSIHQKWLTLLLLGGSIFGIVDHWWNGELFLIGDAILLDLLLGLVITVSLITSWFIIVTLEKSTVKSKITT